MTTMNATARARAYQAAARLDRLRGKDTPPGELWAHLGQFIAVVFRNKTPDSLTEAEWGEVKQRLDDLAK
jgi:hypothetical protein